MRRLSPTRRILVAALAIAQMAAPGLAAIADARLIADGVPQVHVEDHTRAACRPVHPDDCVLCQLLTHSTAPRATAPAVPSVATVRFGAYAEAGLLPNSIARARQRTRAPPVGLS
jgi:hypothetical protein